MGFLSPWFLAGLAAVGLPVWLHLLRKHRSTPLPFSSLMFFERHTQSSIKHKRLRYLVLFALRTALVLLLVLAFAHPYIRTSALPSARTGEVTLFVVDNSLSMRAGGRLEEAKRMARSDVAGLHPGQRAQVLALGSRIQAMSDLADDRTALNAGVEAIEPSDARTSYAELVRATRSIAQTLRLPVHVVLYSDLQQSGMPPNFNDLRLNGDIRLDAKTVASKPEPNFVVENVVAPQRVYDAKKTRVLATIAGFETANARRTVTLVLNGRTIETKTVDVPAGGRATAEFLSMDVPYGRNKGEVRIDSADTLPADDSFYFSVERADARHALFVHEAGNARGLLYFRSALDASGQSAFQLDEATVEQVAGMSPSRYSFVVLSDVGALPGGFENELREYVRQGGAVLIALGHLSASRNTIPVAGEAIEGSHYSGREGALFQTASWFDNSHPVVLANNRWEDVKFYQAIHVTPGNARVAVRLSDQTPLVIDQQVGTGRVLVFASTFDNVANDFPLHASFVPFVQQTAAYLGHLEDGASSVMVGSFGELRDAKEQGSAVDVVGPKGDRALSLAESTKAQNIQFVTAGFYDIRRPNGRNELVAVDTDRRESDLTPAAAETLTLWQNTSGAAGTAGGTGGQAENRPVSLWWYVMIGALILAAAESWLGNRHLSVDKEAA